MARRGGPLSRRGVFVVEDAAQALGSDDPGGHAGHARRRRLLQLRSREDRDQRARRRDRDPLGPRSPASWRGSSPALESPGLVARLRTLVETMVLVLIFIRPALLDSRLAAVPPVSARRSTRRTIRSSASRASRPGCWRTGAPARRSERGPRSPRGRAPGGSARPRAGSRRSLHPPAHPARVPAGARPGLRPGRREGLGFSLMYPAAVTAIPELAGEAVRRGPARSPGRSRSACSPCRSIRSSQRRTPPRSRKCSTASAGRYTEADHGNPVLGLRGVRVLRVSRLPADHVRPRAPVPAAGRPGRPSRRRSR